MDYTLSIHTFPHRLELTSALRPYNIETPVRIQALSEPRWVIAWE